MLRLHSAVALLLATLVLQTSSARADDAARADELSKQAIERAKKKDFKGALELYEQALELEPSVKGQCNVGSAYFQLDQYAQAHLFLGLCLAHTDTLDATFVADLSKAFAYADKKLRGGDFALVDFDTKPAGGELLVQSLSKVARFQTPRRVWLPLGQHAFVATHPEFERQVGTFDVSSKGESEETIELRRPKKQPDAPDTGDENGKESGTDETNGGPDLASKPVPPPEPVAEPSRGPAWIALGVGAVGVLGGVGFHIKAAGISSDLDGMFSGDERDELKADLKRDRLIMAGFYGVGAIALGVGAYLWSSAEAEESPRLNATLLPGGGRVGASWTF